MRDCGPYTLLKNHPYPEPRTAWFTACGGVITADREGFVPLCFACVRVLLNDRIPTVERLCFARFPILVKQTSSFQNWCNRRVSAYAIHCVAIQNVHTAPTNAVFFPSAQMKNLRFMPNFPTETQAIPARTQSTQTLRRSGDERPVPELHKLYWYKPAAAIINPAAAVSPGKRLRGVGEKGEGLRRVRLLSL